MILLSLPNHPGQGWRRPDSKMRRSRSGVQILTMGQLAAGSGGGLLRPIDADALKIAVKEALPTVRLGELEPIKDLPGMVRAAAGTLNTVWSAAIDLPAIRICAPCTTRSSVSVLLLPIGMTTGLDQGRRC